MKPYPISGYRSKSDLSLIVTDRKIDSSAFYLIGKWLIHDKSKKALSYFDALINREDIQFCMGSNFLISFGREHKFQIISLLKAMIDQLNARDDLEIKIDVKEVISNWLKITNTNLVCYISDYAHKCTTMFESISIQFDAYSDEVKFWLGQISHVLCNYTFISSEGDIQMLVDEAEAYFKTVDTDDTVNKTDRNPD